MAFPAWRFPVVPRRRPFVRAGHSSVRGPAVLVRALSSFVRPQTAPVRGQTEGVPLLFSVVPKETPAVRAPAWVVRVQS